MPKRVYDSLAPIRVAAGKITMVYRGTRLAIDDANLIAESLSLRAALLVDLKSSDEIQPAINQYYWSLCSIKDRTIDVFDLGNDIKAMGLALRLYLENYEYGLRDTRRSFLKRAACKYTGLIISPMYNELDEFLAHPNVKVLRSLLQFVDFMTKLNLRSVKLEDLMVQEYDAQEAAMANWTYPRNLISDLSFIVGEWFCGDVPRLRGLCHHGGGSTAEVTAMTKGRLHKDSLLNFSNRLYKLFIHWGGDPAEIPWFSKVVDEDNRCSTLQFVPKSMITNRVISKEPTALMFVQQGLKEVMYSHFRRHPFLRRVIDLQDQSKSANLARKGSRQGSYATLDLSAASDSVSLELVAKLFRRTNWYLPLMESRSTHTQYLDKDGNVVRKWKLRKFAPMGSALCFPVECVVFASICELARRKAGSRKLFRVYGDDLVVPTEYAQEVAELLAQLHFKVNERKSFMNSRKYNFREACGGEYFNNEDVTPCRLSRALKAMTPQPSGSDFESWCGLYNRLYQAGWSAASSYVLRQLKVFWSNWSVFDCIEYSNWENRGLLVYGPTVDRRSIKWNSDWQRGLYWTSHVVATVERQTRIDIDRMIHEESNEPDEVRYYEWLRDAEYANRRFLPVGHVMKLPDYVRPDRNSAVSQYPCRDNLVVTPLA